MLQTYQLNAPSHEIVFVSDLHWGHDRDFIWGKRGFKSVAEHDETLVHRWNEVCTSRTHAWHLGDICFADPTGARFWELMRRLEFDTIYLFLGNHNSGQKQAYLAALEALLPEVAEAGAEVYPLILPVDGRPDKRIIFMPEYLEASINGQRIIMCHYPIISHHKVGHGSWGLFGHSHGSCEFTNKDAKDVGKRVDLGIESFGRPITFIELKRFMDARPVKSYDHHSKDTT